jgi:hypothetical protein
LTQFADRILRRPLERLSDTLVPAALDVIDVGHPIAGSLQAVGEVVLVFPHETLGHRDDARDMIERGACEVDHRPSDALCDGHEAARQRAEHFDDLGDGSIDTVGGLWY